MDALLLSAVTIVYALIGSLFTLTGFIATLLWIIKFAGTMYLLYYFMRQYSASEEGAVTYRQSFKYGFKVSLISSAVCAAYAYLSMTLLFPEKTALVTDTILNTALAQAKSGEEEEIIGKIAGSLPQITLIFSFIYYTIFGAIASSIIANFTKKEDIFADTESAPTPENTAN